MGCCDAGGGGADIGLGETVGSVFPIGSTAEEVVEIIGKFVTLADWIGAGGLPGAIGRLAAPGGISSNGAGAENATGAGTCRGCAACGAGTAERSEASGVTVTSGGAVGLGPG